MNSTNTLGDVANHRNSLFNLKRKMEGLEGVSVELYSTEFRPKSRTTPRTKRERMLETPPSDFDSGSRSREKELSEQEDESEEDEDFSTSEDYTSSDFDSGSDKELSHIDSARRINDDELVLPSGKILGTKSSHRIRRKKSATGNQLQPSPSNSSGPLTTAYLLQISPNTAHSQQVSLRNSAGLVGLSDLQRSALVKEEKRMMAVEGRNRGGFEAGVESRANCQKTYRIGGSRGGKKMGGLEKRLG